MSTEHKKDEESIYHEAVGRPIAERAAYLRQTCEGDSALQARVETLLRSRDEAGDFLESPALADGSTLDNAPLTEGPGTVISRYKLLEKIGEGGMAVVYMAEQERPVRRRVALKIIKLGMDTKQVIARFEAERQALAMMDHPSIAKVFDGGSTETGRPYFVMELVRGASITEYCDVNKLTTQERLELFVQVCNAVQHAHQKGIIHRDVKPSNVMVTLHDDRPLPKVIDFGIAKATSQRLTERTLFTRYAQMIGTPEYMSPEQAQMSSLDVDTRTDIYSLGVLLYQLLTGTTPFDTVKLHQAGYAEMQRIIRETDPLRPSTKLSTLGDTLSGIAALRRSNPQALKKLIKGDLDWIVMKTLEKDRTRRYETAHALAEDVKRHLRDEPVLASSHGVIYHFRKFVLRHRARIAVAAALTVLLVALVVTGTMYRRASNLKWAKGEALPRIVELVGAGEYSTAFSLAQKAQRYIPDDPALVKLLPQMCQDYSVVTEPAGADVWCRAYSAMNEPWQYLGRSPLENVTLPYGPHRWKIEKDEFVKHECVFRGPFKVHLQPQGPMGDMVRITTNSGPPGHIAPAEVSFYLIDKYEVTNEQFKRFVDAGGYEDASYWEGLTFIKDGQQLLWREAVAGFRDKSGLPGPTTWESGTYAQGQGQHPVSGVSWFEAVAYARFVGKSLPTVYDWEQAACQQESLVIVRLSNFGDAGTAPVGSHPGTGHTGLCDMAGNVREWCLNATDDSGGLRYVLGGSWGERPYMFTVKNAQSPWHRSGQDGFRCVKYQQGNESLPEENFQPLPMPAGRDVSDLEPFSDEEFDTLQALYRYDATALEPAVESRDDSLALWREETVTFNAAYGGDRVTIHLFLPKSGKPPYQAVFFFPGGGAIADTSFDNSPYRDLWQCIVMSGRAVVFPVYYGTYERPAAVGRQWGVSDAIERPMTYLDWTSLMAKDLRRSIDYLETRNDIDSDNIGYYGYSFGSILGPIMLAVEDRIDTGIFVHGGLVPLTRLRSFDMALYAQRVKVPVLMVNGSEDVLLPTESSQTPMYELLKEANADSQHRQYPGGHGEFSLFFNQIREDVVEWLDQRLGPVE